MEAPDEGVPLVRLALGVEEARLLERAGGELRELLREAQLLRRQDEAAAPRHRQEAEDDVARVERQGHAAAPRRASAVPGSSSKAGPCAERQRSEELVGVERAPAGLRGRSPLVDRPWLRISSTSRVSGWKRKACDAVELQLARERGDREADDLVGVQREERARGELEEGDGLLAALHERRERAVALEDVADRPREEPDGLLGLGVVPAIVSRTTPKTACVWSFTFTGAPKKEKPALGDLLRAPLREDLLEVLVEPAPLRRPRRWTGPERVIGGTPAPGRRATTGASKKMERGASEFRRAPRRGGDPP